MNHGIALPGVPNHHPADARVDDEPAAHGAGGGAGNEFPGGRVLAGHVEGGPEGLAPGGGDDGVGLRVDRAAQLVPLPRRDVQGLPGSVVQVHTVLSPPGGPVVPGGDNLIALDDDGPIVPPQAGGALRHRFRNVQVLAHLVDSSHGRSPFPDFGSSIPLFPAACKTIHILFTLSFLTAGPGSAIVITTNTAQLGEKVLWTFPPSWGKFQNLLHKFRNFVIPTRKKTLTVFFHTIFPSETFGLSGFSTD